MSKTIQKVLAVVVVVAVTFFSFGAPSLAASSLYSFTMNYRVVDGKSNGEFHTLNKGTVYIDGSHVVYSHDPGATSYNDIYYCLIRDRLGPNVKCGSVSFPYSKSPSGKLGTADKDSSKYYLQIFKIEDDGHNMRGAGTIYN